jgi:FkbM family methyltransferase
MYIQRKPGQHILEVYGDSGNIPYEQLKGKGLVKVKAVGFGCCLVNGDVFRQMPYPHFDYKTALDHKDTVSEDWYFCNKAAQLGFETWVDASLHCEHIGDIRFTINDNIQAPQEPSRLEVISQQDLLPKAHADYLKKMAEDTHPTVIYDIGACVLHWTRKAKEAWPTSQYYLFDAANAVEPFLEKSGHPYNVGVLTDEDEKQIEFYENPDHPGGNSYYLETTGAFNESHKSTRIGYTLDSIVSHHGWPLPDMIKMDVQGAEVDILKGATRCLSKCKDVILEAQHVNYNDGAPKVRDVIQYMESLGFTLIKKFCAGDVDADYHFKRL